MKAGVGQRARVDQTAPTNWEAALKIARGMTDPWYKAQSLAHVVRYAPESRVKDIAKAGLKAAFEGRDGYQRIGSSAWVLGALIERKQIPLALQTIDQLVAEADKFDMIGSKSLALMCVFSFAINLGIEHSRPVADRLAECARTESSWRCARNMSWVVQMLAEKDVSTAKHYLEAIRPGIYKSKALRAIASVEAAGV